MKHTDFARLELLCQSHPTTAQALLDLFSTMATVPANINAAEVAAHAGLQQVGSALLHDWAQSTAESKPAPGVEKHVKKK
jgi:hypothetical protein